MELRGRARHGGRLHAADRRHRYAWIVDHTFEVDKASFPAGARSSDPIQGDFISQATDDTEWWALAWIDAYDLTGDTKYLNEAVTIATHVNSLWDTSSCGGGVWWNASRRTRTR